MDLIYNFKVIGKYENGNLIISRDQIKNWKTDLTEEQISSLLEDELTITLAPPYYLSIETEYDEALKKYISIAKIKERKSREPISLNSEENSTES